MHPIIPKKCTVFHNRDLAREGGANYKQSSYEAMYMFITNTQYFTGKAHLREALLMHEEALRVNRMCRELRKKDILQDVLRLSHDRSLNKYADVDDEDDFQVRKRVIASLCI